MSRVSLSGNALGTGTFTIASPNSNTDRTLTLPDSAGTLTTTEAIVAAGYTTSAEVLTQFNATGAAPVYACRAWVNFNGTGTVAIRASGNVTSITDNGTGDYTVNFTTAMPDANYSFVAQAGNGGVLQTAGTSLSGAAPTTSSARFIVDNGAGSLQDREYVMAAVFR